MSWLLDTNACICYLNGRSLPLKNRIEARNESEIVTCSVVKAELFFGAARSTDPARTFARQNEFISRFTSFAFDDACAEVYGQVRAELASRGVPIGPNDMLIASIALANQLTLVTCNVAEFRRVPNLAVENWESPD